MKKKLNHNLKNSTKSENDLSVMIMKEICFDDTKIPSSHLQIINLQHPRFKKNTAFLYNNFSKTLQEILKFSQPYRSWFIGNNVVSNGKLFLCTPIDPLFLVLPYLFKATMSSTLDQLLHDDNYEDAQLLETVVDFDQLSLIAEKKDYHGLIVWKYSEDKTLLWLSNKVNKVSSILKEKNVHVDSASAISSSYVITSKNKDSDENFLRYAYGIVSDYLDLEISVKLHKHLKLPVEEIYTKKRKNTNLDADEIKRLKVECIEKEKLKQEFINNEFKSEKARKNPKHTALAKAASGSKDISSFFKKK